MILIRLTLILALIAGTASLHAVEVTKESFEKSLSAEDWEEMFEIAGSVVASCTEKFWTNPADLQQGVRQMVSSTAEGAVRVGAEFASSLLFKKDYPNACHVLTQEHLSVLDQKKSKIKPCINWFEGRCIQKEERTQKEYSYYWPKYLIEVSEKGNDSFPAFSENNQLYKANRHLANLFSKFIDSSGPFKLAAKVVGSSKAIKAATSVFLPGSKGVTFSENRSDVGNLSQAAVLTPFEKLRIRANKDAEQPSYEVNIWPVGLSKSLAEHMTICGDGNSSTNEGGFGWPIPGVGMTCPVAMSQDAWSYWDSGIIDYLNPNAMRGVVAASNPAACAADNLGSALFDEYHPQGFESPVGDSASKSNLQNRISKMAPGLQGLRYCSAPIMGDIEALYNQTTNLTNSFKGPWCTLWGPLVPRNSTSTFQNDFSMANAALKFKSLSHDLFGVPRGSNERWSMVYPWSDNLGAFEKLMHGLKEYIPAASVSGDLKKPRSTLLAYPGDPRLIDTTFELETNTANLIREIGYIAGLSTLADEAERATLEELRRQQGISKPPTPEQAIEKLENDLSEVEEATATFEEEPIYEVREFCHAFAEKKHEIRDCGKSFNTSYQGYIKHSDLRYCPGVSEKDCMATDIGHCDRDFRHECKRKRKGQIVHYKRLVQVGTRKVQHPRVFSKKRGVCQVRTDQSYSKIWSRAWCEDQIVEHPRRDTAHRIKRPDVAHPEKDFQENPETASQVAQAAKVATWVGGELARAKFERTLGTSTLPGKKRIYAIHEKVSCKPESYTVNIAGIQKHGLCKEAVRIEIKKFIQTKLLRKICDKAFQSTLGDPFKKG